MRSLLPLSIVLLAASTALPAQTYTVLHNFGSKPGDPREAVEPGTIAQGRGGAMLTTSENFGLGKAFRIWPGGSLQVLHVFPFENDIQSGLILATDGKFYGGSSNGGTFSQGMIFKMSRDGRVTKLHDFTGGSDGGWPKAGPIQSVEGDFYGTTTGANSKSGSYGTVYRITKYGNFTLLHAFTGNDGANPEGPLVQGTDFYFYGTTGGGGGQANFGTIFRVSSSGNFKVLVNFNGANGNATTNNSGVIQANDGNFYGVTFFGGSSNLGVLFRMKPDGTLTVLHNFIGGSDGAKPTAGLIQASDGNLYGITQEGGKENRGVLFRATLAGDVVTVHEFIDATGNYPQVLFQHTNGKLYGETFGGGTSGRGVFCSLDAGLPPFVSYLPTYGRPGALVQILGQGFTADSKVSFKGTPATSPVVVSPTYIRVIVPAGATTGPITVTTANGTLTSNKVFIVHPQ
jgi:uncharacterized repeat protein (TIGR03803 family)